MASTSRLYRIRVSPGIFTDGTFGVYLVPRDNPQLERQLECRLTQEQAGELANAHREIINEILFDNNIEFSNERANDLPQFYSNLSEKELDSLLHAYMKKGISSIKVPSK